MPIYEYECLACGTTFDKRQGFHDEPIADCPNGHNETRRLIAAPAIVFKGSGFYINDSKKGDKNSKNGSQSSSKEMPNTGAAAKSDDKSESKSEANSDNKSEKSSDSKPKESKKEST